jgi:putative sterol carrier protein
MFGMYLDHFQASGKLNPQAAFIKGKLKVAGNIMLTQKLAALMKEESKL